MGTPLFNAAKDDEERLRIIKENLWGLSWVLDDINERKRRRDRAVEEAVWHVNCAFKHLDERTK